MNYFGNLVVFGVQKGDFLQWCVGKSRQETESYLFNSPPSNHTFLTSSHLNFIDRKNGMGLYNCSRLWEDEIKLSVIVFIIMFITYIHFAVCFWCYTQDRMREYEEALAFELTNSSMMHNHNNNMMMHNPSMMGGQNHNVMMNIPRAAKTKGQDSKRNLADITRNFFGNLRYSP
ncbi:hypothetical protein BDF20DRAFT_914753 [Mycotypha africana]|uniref:uncharacterized protein n=1 Tax=Mycotypha africana TaxID=64632 RepID=UPI002300BB9C|nr:uncharacterized protein BDF20DRAFT_914753 [Mycotypha africana]KAI8973283.1 hypothetical protein BDF20DRAFT_914753 [Mycotypha africana]